MFAEDPISIPDHPSHGNVATGLASAFAFAGKISLTVATKKGKQPSFDRLLITCC